MLNEIKKRNSIIWDISNFFVVELFLIDKFQVIPE